MKGVFVLGGARSGKSAFAEEVASHFPRVALLATARAPKDDEELAERIERHRARRPSHWLTLEPPDEFDALLEHGSRRDVDLAVVDCATLWLAWRLSQDYARYSAKQLLAHLENECRGFVAGLAALSARGVPFAVVSNETGSGVVPSSPAGRHFRDALGLFNRVLSEACGVTVLVVAGRPVCLAGAELVAAAHGGPSIEEVAPGLAPLHGITPAAVARYLRTSEGPPP